MAARHEPGAAHARRAALRVGEQRQCGRALHEQIRHALLELEVARRRGVHRGHVAAVEVGHVLRRGVAHREARGEVLLAVGERGVEPVVLGGPALAGALRVVVDPALEVGEVLPDRHGAAADAARHRGVLLGAGGLLDALAPVLDGPLHVGVGRRGRVHAGELALEEVDDRAALDAAVLVVLGEPGEGLVVDALLPLVDAAQPGLVVGPAARAARGVAGVAEHRGEPDLVRVEPAHEVGVADLADLGLGVRDPVAQLAGLLVVADHRAQLAAVVGDEPAERGDPERGRGRLVDVADDLVPADRVDGVVELVLRADALAAALLGVVAVVAQGADVGAVGDGAVGPRDLRRILLRERHVVAVIGDVVAPEVGPARVERAEPDGAEATAAEGINHGGAPASSVTGGACRRARAWAC